MSRFMRYYVSAKSTNHITRSSTMTRENATDTQRGGHEDNIVAVVRACLVDDEANVRAAAAKAFDSLQEHLGARAIDQTIPTLLEALRQPGESSGTALQALKEVMNVSRPDAYFAVSSAKHIIRFVQTPSSRS